MPTRKRSTQPVNSIGTRRRAAGLSQRELARRVGCCHSYIGGVETGRVLISESLTYRIAAVLDCTVWELLSSRYALQNTREDG